MRYDFRDLFRDVGDGDLMARRPLHIHGLRFASGGRFCPFSSQDVFNPPLAFRALCAGIDIGLLLPCNVNVYEDPKTGETVVSAVDPRILVEVTGRKELAPIAEEVRGKLTAALEAV
jgi:hypothetical protein